MARLARFVLIALLFGTPALAQSAPWARTHVFSSLEAGHDDQPITYIRPTIAVWGFLSDWTSIGARVSANAFQLGDTASRSMSTYALTLSQTFSGGRITLSGDAGAVHESWSDATDATGSVGLIAKLNAWSSVNLKAERLPYTSTEASLSTPVMHWRYSGDVTVARNGWNGDAGIQRLSFASNDVTSAYAWVLAPVAPARQQALQLGYGFAAEDSRKLMYAGGIYTPYYTPRNVHVHSALASASASSGRVSFHANGSYGFIASEDAPQTISSGVGNPRGQAAVVAEISRSFHPWSIKGSVQSRLTRNATLVAAAEALRTAFYHAQTATLSLDYTIGK